MHWVVQVVADAAPFPLADPQNFLLQPLAFRHLLREGPGPLPNGGFELSME